MPNSNESVTPPEEGKRDVDVSEDADVFGEVAPSAAERHAEVMKAQRRIFIATIIISVATIFYAVAALGTLGFLVYEYNNPNGFLVGFMPGIMDMFSETLAEAFSNAIQNIPDCTCPPQNLNATTP